MSPRRRVILHGGYESPGGCLGSLLGEVDAELAADLVHDVAGHRLGTAEHRLSRLITQGLGEKNFNQMINRHRIAYACARLADADDDATILDISGDAGFASLGPFNRAFKAATGCTPTAYRAAHRTTTRAELELS